MKGKITEVFSSIQGEGLYLGEKQIFVRFFGCNLKCKFCDTRQLYFREYSPQELFQEIRQHQDDHRTISFTGGEPLLQKYFLKEMLMLTRQEGYKNYLETNGTLHRELKTIINYVDIIAMDLKLPTSTGHKNFWQHHRHFLEAAASCETFLKMVVCQSTQEQDIEEALRLIKEVNKFLILVLQPDSNEDDAQMKAKLERFQDICKDNHIVSCIIPQMHKKLGLR